MTRDVLNKESLISQPGSNPKSSETSIFLTSHPRCSNTLEFGRKCYSIPAKSAELLEKRKRSCSTTYNCFCHAPSRHNERGI
jgi:hypothetical protein